MSSTEETLTEVDVAMEAVLTKARGVLLEQVAKGLTKVAEERAQVAEERAQVAEERAKGLAELAEERAQVAEERTKGLADVANERKKGRAQVAEERTKGLDDVARERANALGEVDVRRAELACEGEAMHNHREAQEGLVELDIGGYRFETSVQTLRMIPHTFFDAYFSGRYAQDVCTDGSIFVDHDGEHFGHILEYMRHGVVSVAEPGACPSVSLLRALKREFGFYCIEL
jgi:hypothetical protein